MRQTTKGFVPVLIIIICAISISAVGYIAYQSNKNIRTQPNKAVDQTTSPTNSWETYKDDSGSFTFKHPKTWSINFYKGPKNIKIIGPDRTITKDKYLKGKDYNPGYETYERYGEISETTIDSKRAFTQTTGRDDFGVDISTVIEMTKDTGLFVSISYNAGNDTKLREEYKNEAIQILSTFAFKKNEQ